MGENDGDGVNEDIDVDTASDSDDDDDVTASQQAVTATDKTNGYEQMDQWRQLSMSQILFMVGLWTTLLWTSQAIVHLLPVNHVAVNVTGDSSSSTC